MTTAPMLETREDAPGLRQQPDRRPTRGGFDLRAVAALYRLTLRQHLHGKRWMVMAVLFLLPAVLAVCIRASAPAVPPRGLEFMFVFMFIPQGLLPLVALLYASGILRDEQEEQTLTYLLIRPIPKWAIYVVKLLATLTTTVLLTALFTALTYAAIYARSNEPTTENIPLRCLKTMSIHGLAVAGYCCVFGLMSLFTKRTLIVGVLYAAIFEGLFGNLPMSIRLITVIYYTRIIAFRTLDFMVLLPNGFRENLAGEVWQLDLANDPQLTEHPQLRTCVTVLVCACAAFTAIAAYLCSRREFHVKTPEKA